ncbi:hypothetical protein [Actinoplanes sp. NPDC020271]|uniref:hypothetical protein n=1 Tax=Actinoplanes sp. NPDC020271 TaxID=3363896 RepID=UPI0037A2173C
MEMETARAVEKVPAGRARRWWRWPVIVVSCAPLAVIMVLHRMRIAGDAGILGRWYVGLSLTVAGIGAWLLIEKTIGWSVRGTARPGDQEPGDRH